MRRKFHHFVSKHAFDIDGCGPKTIDQLMDEGLVTTYADLFSLTEGDVEGLEGFAKLAAKNLISGIQKAKKVSLDRLLIALSIDHVGEETARDIAAAFGTLSKIQNASVEDLIRVEGVGEIVARSLHSWFRDSENEKTVRELLEHISITKVDRVEGGVLIGKTFVITGTLGTMSREEAEALIRSAGGSATGSVSKKTSYVIVGENPGSKAEKALQLGVPTLSEQEFKALIS